MGWMPVPRQMRIILQTEDTAFAVVLDESEVNRIEREYHKGVDDLPPPSEA